MSVYGNPISALIDRLAYHTTTGLDPARMLDGWKWFDMPLEHPDGQQDFPSLQLFLPDISETSRNAFGQGALRVKLSVSVARNQVKAVAALMDGVAAVINAIETDTNGNIDVTLNRTIKTKAEFSAGNGFSSPNALTLEVIVSLMPKLFERGQR